jgi:signal transduction histidine kinase
MREERRRILRDLHDEVGGQILDIIHLYGDDGGLREAATSALGSLREVIYYLDDAEPVDIDLAVSRWRLLARERCDAAGMRLDWRAPENVGVSIMPRRMYYNLNLVMKEALTNAVRHGKDSLEAEIRVGPERLSFRFVNPASAGHETGRGGRGLNNIRSRVAELGGGVDCRVRDGLFVLEWWVPFPAGGGGIAAMP